MTKTELKQMIRECLQEELATHSLIEGGAMSGGYAEDLAIAADNSDYPREVKYLAAHMKNKGVATIGESAAKPNNTRAVEALDETEDFDLDNIFEALDRLYEEVEDLASDEIVDTNLDEGIFDGLFGRSKNKQEAAPVAVDSFERRNEIKKLARDLYSELHADSAKCKFALGMYLVNEANYAFEVYNVHPADDSIIGLICIELKDEYQSGRDTDRLFTRNEGLIKRIVDTFNATSVRKNRNLHFAECEELRQSFQLYLEVWNYGGHYS